MMTTLGRLTVHTALLFPLPRAMSYSLPNRASPASSMSRLPVLAFDKRSAIAKHQTSAAVHSATTTNNDDTIITPRDPNTAFNFGPASTRDNVLFTCERPGGEPENGKIPLSAVEEWAEFMRKRGIDEVLVLLDDNELKCYEDPGLIEMYKMMGFKAHRNPMGEVGASANALALISERQTSGKKIVAHCTHGQGRAGRVAAAWLAHQYDLTPDEATEEALALAREKGVTRLGSATKLKKWLDNV